MGEGSDGVVDSDLRHRSRENLYVSGGAVFPTASPTHPTLTIAALAIRLGRTLAAERT
jgi:choline dehydrogenase-like flavoprotein